MFSGKTNNDRKGPKTAMAVCAATLADQQIPDFNFT